MNHIISPILLGAGHGRVVVKYPAFGEVVHSGLSQEGQIVIWVRHPIEAVLLNRAFLLEAPNREIPANAVLVDVVQFEMQVEVPQPSILIPGQNGAGSKIINRQIVVFVLDLGLTNEEVTRYEPNA